MQGFRIQDAGKQMASHVLCILHLATCISFFETAAVKKLSIVREWHKGHAHLIYWIACSYEESPS